MHFLFPLILSLSLTVPSPHRWLSPRLWTATMGGKKLGLKYLPTTTKSSRPRNQQHEMFCLSADHCLQYDGQCCTLTPMHAHLKHKHPLTCEVFKDNLPNYLNSEMQKSLAILVCISCTKKVSSLLPDVSTPYIFKIRFRLPAEQKHKGFLRDFSGK